MSKRTLGLAVVLVALGAFAPAARAFDEFSDTYGEEQALENAELEYWASLSAALDEGGGFIGMQTVAKSKKKKEPDILDTISTLPKPESDTSTTPIGNMR